MATSTAEKQKHIRGGEFLIRDQEADEIFIPEDFSEEQNMMAQATTEFMEKEVAPHRERFEQKDYKFTEELMKKIREQGLLGITVPEDLGGLGMDFNTSMLVTDRISGISGSLSTAYGAHTGIGVLPILLYGTEEQRKKYLPKLSTGKYMGAYCLTEPGAGSDANSGKTKAEITEEGNYKINGQKIWISNAGFADVFIVFARIENDKYLTGFIVERDTEGLSFGEEENKMGIRASSTRQVFFNDVMVPAGNLLGERNGGFKIAMNALNYGRVKLAVATLDAGRRVISQSVQYANEREQFGTAISSFGAIQQKLADMATLVWASESAVYRAGQEIENRIQQLQADGVKPSEAKLQGAEEFAIECAMLKVFGSEVNAYVVDEGVQIYGGMGYSADAPMEAAYRDARITRIYEGTNEINRMHSVGMLLKKGVKGELDLMTPAMAVANELMEIPSFETPDGTVLFAREKEMLSKLKKAMLMVAGKAVEKFGAEIEEEQQLLMNAADMMIQIYGAESALLRAEKLVKQKGEDAVKQQINMAKLNLYFATEIIGTKGRGAIYSFAEGDEQRMMLMGLKRFTKLTDPIKVKKVRKEIAAVLIEANKYPF
ncbi:MAG: acyl-CoA dehydrogenase family protein [Owenweeksia sp.]|nr:acyl-CoA dehydrogenase family protein [Owenweeksia sp.]